jgi:hypothetical protein
MNNWWQPSFDPMEELIVSRNKILQLEVNERALVQAQNQLGQAYKDLITQHNDVIEALHNHKREIEQLKNLYRINNSDK